MSFASLSLSQLFLQRGPFRYMQIDVARNAALAPYIGCKEYCTPYRKIKPCQARSRKLILCTTALLWALHSLMWWDGRSWDRTWDWIVQAVLGALLWLRRLVHDELPVHRSGLLPRALRSAVLCSERRTNLVTYQWWHLCHWKNSVTDFHDTQVWLQTVQLLN